MVTIPLAQNFFYPCRYKKEENLLFIEQKIFFFFLFFRSLQYSFTKE